MQCRKHLPAQARRKYDIMAFADKKRYEEEKANWVPPPDRAPKLPKKKLAKARQSITGATPSSALARS